MSVDKATVARIAHLARIAVPEENLEPLAAELNQILAFVEQLNEVDTGNIAPMTSVADMKLRRREDIVTDGGYPEARRGAWLLRRPQSHRIGRAYVLAS